jgi:CheY-like chemotaxis protein
MTKRLCAGALVFLTAVSVQPALRACGDKFLVNSRGTRFERAPGARQGAAILVFADPGNGVPASVANAPLTSLLRKAGYRPTTADTAASFTQALSTRTWDVVVIDLATGPTVPALAQSGPAAPVVVRLARNLTGAALAQARKDYGRVVESPAKSAALLDVLDEAVAARRKSAVKASGTGN